MPNTEAARKASIQSKQCGKFTRYLREMREAGYTLVVTAPSHLPEKYRAA